MNLSYFLISLFLPFTTIHQTYMSTRESMLLDAIGDRFEVLLRRYDLFVLETPARFEKWLADAPKFSALETVCIELFPDLLATDDAPRRWMLAVSMVALKHHVGQLNGVELSVCGQALRVLADEPAETTVPVAIAPAVLIKALSYTSALEVKVAELEYRLHKQTPAQTAQTKRSSPCLPDTPEQTVAFLCERRAEALDALIALRRTRGRKNEKLSEEATVKSEAPVKPSLEPILPKRALSLAGYWNIMPNDLLAVTPALIEAIEEKGGTVIRREGMHVCFTLKERDLVTSVALEVMDRMMPHYKRREED
jgi:hypothetical protein